MKNNIKRRHFITFVLAALILAIIIYFNFKSTSEIVSTVWPIVYHGVELFVGTVVVKYIILHWVADQTRKILKKIMIRTKQQAILWIHYREKAIGHNHQYPTPETCKDGVCKTYNAMTLPNIPV